MPLPAGIYPPIPTPFDEDGELDLGALAVNLEWWGHHDLAGVVVLGSNGEAILLDRGEKLRLIERARARSGEGRTVIAGTGLPSTRATIALTRDAAAAGADAALVLPPSYYRGLMTDAALEHHYRAVADASPVPLLLYNMPRCTGIDLGAELIVSLAGHEMIVGMKESGGDVVKLAALRAELGNHFKLFAGSAGFLLPALTVGAVGGILALANVAPRECLEIVRFVAAGNMQAAAEQQLRLIAPNDAVTRRWGVPALKAALELIGLRGGSVRSPLLPLSPDRRQALRTILQRAGISTTNHEEASV